MGGPQCVGTGRLACDRRAQLCYTFVQQVCASLQHNPLMQYLVNPRIGAPINNPLAQYVLLFQQSHHPPQLLYLWFGQCFGEQVCGHVLRLQVDWMYALAINLIA